MSVGPESYGAGLWHYLNSSAGLAHTPEQRQNFVELLEVIGRQFPCELCRQHLQETMAEYRLDKFNSSAERLLLWMYMAHDAANNHYNRDNPTKPRKVSPPWKEVKDKYLTSPDEEEEVPMNRRPVARMQSRPVPNVSGRRQLTISHPLFDQWKSGFHTLNGR